MEQEKCFFRESWVCVDAEPGRISLIVAELPLYGNGEAVFNLSLSEAHELISVLSRMTAVAEGK